MTLSLVTHRYLQLLCRLSLLAPSAQSGSNAVSTYVDRILLPASLRLEFGQSLDSLAWTVTSDDAAGAKRVDFVGFDSAHGPHLLCACLGYHLRHHMSSGLDPASNVAPPLRISDRSLLATLTSIYGDAPTSNTCSLSQRDLVLALSRHISLMGHTLLVTARGGGACTEYDSYEVVKDSSVTHVPPPDRSYQDAEKAAHLLLRLLESCCEMLHLVCAFYLRVVAERDPSERVIADGQELIGGVLDMVSALCSDIGVTCHVEHDDHKLDLSCKTVCTPETMGMESYHCHDSSDDVGDGDSKVRAIHQEKAVEQRRLLDQRLKKILYRIGREMKVLRSGLEGQRSSKAD